MYGLNSSQFACAAFLWPALVAESASENRFAPGHSLVAALQGAGMRRVFVTDWRSASPDMRFLSIDNYLADLNVLVDELGSWVNLLGLYQDGWMALIYAARFPGKVARLALAGAPIDLAAGKSKLSELAATRRSPFSRAGRSRRRPHPRAACSAVLGSEPSRLRGGSRIVAVIARDRLQGISPRRLPARSHPPPADEPYLHQMSQYRIAEQQGRDQGPIKRRKRRKAERSPRDGEGEGDSNE